LEKSKSGARLPFFYGEPMKVDFELKGKHLAMALAVVAGVCWYTATQNNLCAGLAVTFGLLSLVVE